MSRQSAIEFAKWLKVAHPGIYKRAAKAADIAVANGRDVANGNLSGLGITEGEQVGPATTDKSGWFSTFLQSAATLGTTYLSIKNQQDQMDLNIQRAQQGLPPVDVQQQPIMTANVQLPPDTVTKITQSAGTQINKMMLFGGLALAAFLLLR